jgi:DNA-repair protein complementing XP-A cells
MARDCANETSTTSRTPSGFIATADVSIAGRKRSHEAISTEPAPATVRDASKRVPADEGIQPARKFKKYVDFDFSKGTDTKGGFLTVEDDPHNKALHAPEKDGGKPAHMTLKEWERMQLIKGLKNRKEGMFEPGLSVLEKKGKKCKECGTLEINWQFEEVFGVCVCRGCEVKFPDRYSLLTKTEAKDDYLLTDRKCIIPFRMETYVDSLAAELKDTELLPRLSKPNPQKSHWHDMQLFLRFQVEEYAIKKWGSLDAMDEEFERRGLQKKKRKEDQFQSKLKVLKKNIMADKFRRNMKNGNKAGKFGDAIGNGKHEHEWGIAVERDGMSVRTCVDCGMEVEELEF